MADNVIKTARRVFEVLEYVDGVRRPVSLKEITSHLTYPASSASTLLKSMVIMGYLDYDGFSRTYMPTMRIAALGDWIGGALLGEGRIIAAAQHVSHTINETIVIATQSDLFTQYIHVIPSSQELRYHLMPGTLRPLARSGLGWLLLTARSDAVIDKLVRRINAVEKDRTLHIKLADLLAKLEGIRGRGFVYSRQTVTPGAGMIGMLLPERRHGRVLAIGAGGPIDRLDQKQERIIAEMHEGIGRYLSAAPASLS